jgi:hypothetical protein
VPDLPSQDLLHTIRRHLAALTPLQATKTPEE